MEIMNNECPKFKEIRIISWNINGLRTRTSAVLELIWEQKPCILNLQETKTALDRLDDQFLNLRNYHFYCNPAVKGHKGVLTLSKPEAKQIILETEPWKSEKMSGRLIRLDYPEFILFNVYFPVGMKAARQEKFEFYRLFFEELKPLLVQGKRIIVCGDFNIAHEEIDLHNPKVSRRVTGFTQEERMLLDEFLSLGFLDIFREKYPEKVQYSRWDHRLRKENKGWRIDYFYVSENLVPFIKDVGILDENTYGSDHAPIFLDLIF